MTVVTTSFMLSDGRDRINVAGGGDLIMDERVRARMQWQIAGLG
jgi:hypothetical protein